MILLLDADSMAFSSCYLDGEELIDIEVALDKYKESFSNLLQDIEEKQGIVFDTCYTFIGNYGNFRKTIDPNYKANRKKSNYPAILQDLKIRIAEEYDGLIGIGYESDDVVASSWNLFKDLYGRDKVVIATIDKDLKQLPCLYWDYYYSSNEEKNNARERYIDISEEEANRYFWTQMITGDSSDNIKGVKGMGKVAAEKLLKPLTSNNAMMMAVYRNYRRVYGELRGRKEFIKNHYLLKLRFDAQTPKVEF